MGRRSDDAWTPTPRWASEWLSGSVNFIVSVVPGSLFIPMGHCSFQSIKWYGVVWRFDQGRQHLCPCQIILLCLCPDKIEDIQEAEEERKRRDERKRKTWKWKSKVVIANDDHDHDHDDDDEDDDDYDHDDDDHDHDDDDHDDGKVARTGVRLLAALAMISLFIWQVRLLIRGCGNIVQINQVTK